MEKLLECCVDSVESAVIAAQNGADRLELCANLMIGGTSPSPALFREIRTRVSAPIRVLLRPRFGDFLYTEAEFAVIRREIRMFRELGADGVVAIRCAPLSLGAGTVGVAVYGTAVKFQ